MSIPAVQDALFMGADAPPSRVPDDAKQHESAQVQRPSRNVAILPAPRSDLHPVSPSTVAGASGSAATTPEEASAPRLEQKQERGCSPPPLRECPEEYAQYQIRRMEVATEPPCSASGGKRKRLEVLTSILNGARAQSGKRRRLEVLASILHSERKANGTPTKRKGTGDFLRKGQWTVTEERLARMLIEAFEDGYLPIYTGIRLRGYLAVQLQCDPMRVSKKLCAGVVDGKPIPKNYGQKKFALRTKLLWDREHANRVLAALEQQTREMWRESAMSPPAFLSLSSTRSAPEAHALVALDDDAVPSRDTCSPQAARAKKQQGVVFPIIYLNLSKKRKQQPSADGDASANTTASSDEDDVRRESEPVQVDGESLQAAYNLLTLGQPDARPRPQ